MRRTFGWILSLAAIALAGWRGVRAVDARERRALAAAAFAADSELLATVSRQVGSATDSLASLLNAAREDSSSGRPYLVVSIADNRLWYKQGDEVLFTTRVATGTGKHLEGAGTAKWKFETPRGRLTVQRKDVEPAWVPPDWHYVEAAKTRRKKLYALQRGRPLPMPSGSTMLVSGNDVVVRTADGRETPIEVREGTEIIVGDRLVMPPIGTNQRKYLGVLGVNRLYLGDGYGIHGTDAPTSIGRAASHGCIRVRNEDIEYLWRVVGVGTPVYVY